MDSDSKSNPRSVGGLHCECCLENHKEMMRFPSPLDNSKNKKRKSREEDCVSTTLCCDEDWIDFTAETTLHGLKYIWLRNSSCPRKFLWLLLTLICLGLMMYQIIDRAIYFYQWPVTVNVKIKYNDSLAFPSLTLCNQNAFRATAAESMGSFPLIYSMFDDIYAFKSGRFDLGNTTNLTFADLYTSTGHTKEDMIIRCDWRGEKCGPENFTEIATDYGKCFTFNNLDSPPLFVDSPGSKDGLTLTLNIEQYEYMPGPNDAAGVKILLHDRHQFPNVRELGLVLSAGTHSLVGMKRLSVENLPKPHGQCSSPKPRHFKRYSLETCALECHTGLLRELCGCRLYHMPEIGGTPLCTLQEYFSCYKPNVGLLREQSKQVCSCPVPCDFVLFEPSVSYATSSPLVTDRFLASTNRSVLKAKYDDARDVTHRLRPEKRKMFSEHITNLGHLTTKIQNFIMKEIEEKLHQQDQAVQQVGADINKITNETKYLYEYQEFVVKKNFIRVRTAMNERTFSSVAFAMQEFAFDMATRMRYLAENHTGSEVIKEILFLDITRQLDAKLDITKRAYQNYTQFLNALETGKPIFGYKFRQESRRHNKYVVPLDYFHEALNMSHGARKEGTDKMGRDLLNIANVLENYKSIAKVTHTTGSFNETDVFLNEIQYLSLCRTYLQSRGEILYDTPARIMSLLATRATMLSKLKEKFDHALNDIGVQLRGISWQAQTLSQGHRTMKAGVFQEILRGIHLAQEFLNGTVSKKDVATQFLSEEIQETKHLLKVFFTEVRSRGNELYDDWTEMKRAAIEIWSLAIDDVNLQTYYEFKNKTNVLVDKAEKIGELTDLFDGYRSQLDLRQEMDHVYAEFLRALAAMLKEMTDFKASEDLNVQFLKENILKMSIFYRELSYEEITQQRAYDIFALLCDVGGSMGLFVGASVISIFEVLDLIGFTYMDRLRKRRS